MAAQYSDDALLRVAQIVGRPAVTEEEAARNRQQGRGPRRARPAVLGILNMGRSSFFAKVRSGEFPPAAKILGPGISTWRYEWIRRLSEQVTPMAASDAPEGNTYNSSKSGAACHSDEVWKQKLRARTGAKS